MAEENQDANGLLNATKIPIGKKMIFVDPDTNEGGNIAVENLIYQVLSGLTSQNFDLEQGQMTLPQAIGQAQQKLNDAKINESNLYTGELYNISRSGRNTKILGTSFYRIPDNIDTLYVQMHSEYDSVFTSLLFLLDDSFAPVEQSGSQYKSIKSNTMYSVACADAKYVFVQFNQRAASKVSIKSSEYIDGVKLAINSANYGLVSDWKNIVFQSRKSELSSTISALDLGFVINDFDYDNSSLLNFYSKFYYNITFSTGLYHFSSPVTLTDRCRVSGDKKIDRKITNAPKRTEYLSYNGTVFWYDGTDTFLSVDKLSSIENVIAVSESYTMTVDQSQKTDINLFFAVTQSENTVNGIDVVSGDVHDCMIYGFNGYGIQFHEQHKTVENIFAKYCGTGFMFRNIDNLIYGAWISCCTTGMVFDEGHQGLFDTWIDCIKGNAIEISGDIPKATLALNASGAWVDLCGGAFVKNEGGKVTGIVTGRIHRCNTVDVMTDNMECGNIEGDSINVNLISDLEDNFYTNKISSLGSERYAFYSPKQDVRGVVIGHDRKNIANNMDHIVAIMGGDSIET
nr:hypothetical protein [uncultured Blautia sp.]